MIDPQRVTAAVMEFMENPTWKEIFTNAPGGAMERLAISFYFSKYHDEFKPEEFQEYRDLRDEYEKSLTEEDLNYLIEHTDKENAVKHYQDILAKLQQSGGQPTGHMRFEKDDDSGKGEEQTEEEAASREQSAVGEQIAVEEKEKEVQPIEQKA